MITTLELEGQLSVITPLHIGAADEGDLVDEELMRDGQGRILIPGTSLAGVLRSLLSDDELWGESEGDFTTSVLTVCDAWADAPPAIETRTMNSIDRRTGGVAAHHLHSREHVLPGATFRFRCYADCTPENSERVEQLMLAIKGLLTKPGIKIGKGTSTGNGHIRLTNSTLKRREFTPAGLLESLGGGTEIFGDATTAPRASNRVFITIPFEAEGALFVGQTRDGTVIDTVPLTRTDGENVRFLLPGSSIKGVFRSRAEFIARTVTGADVPERFLDQLSQTGLQQIADLFGSSHDGFANRGALSFNDVTSTTTVNKQEYQGLIKMTKTQSTEKDALKLVDSINQELVDGDFLDIAVRNSVDRFSGNTVAGALFSTLEPHVSWNALSITLDLQLLRELADSDQKRMSASYALLAFLLIDLVEGAMHFGANTTRGSGGVVTRPEHITITWPNGRFSLADFLYNEAFVPFRGGVALSWGLVLEELEEATHV